VIHILVWLNQPIISYFKIEMYLSWYVKYIKH